MKEELFRTAKENSVCALYACTGQKGNVYYQVFKNYKDSFNTLESIPFNNFNDAIKTYILWANN